MMSRVKGSSQQRKMMLEVGCGSARKLGGGDNCPIKDIQRSLYMGVFCNKL